MSYNEEHMSTLVLTHSYYKRGPRGKRTGPWYLLTRPLVPGEEGRPHSQVHDTITDHYPDPTPHKRSVGSSREDTLRT